MASLVEINPSVSDRLSSISSRLMLMALNIHVELRETRFSLSRSTELRQQADVSLVSSSPSNPLMVELLACVQYYCDEVNELAESLRSLVTSPIIDELMQGSKVCSSILEHYQEDRMGAVQSLLSSPFREDAWHLVYEIDLNLFGKCRIILIRLQTSFLLLHRVITQHDLLTESPTKKRRESAMSVTSVKRGKA